MKNKCLIIFLLLILCILTGCSNNSNGRDSNNSTSVSRECNMGEQEVDGMCCRYIYKYPNKDGSCPNGYDDDPPPSGNRNVCWRESCR